jgi:hypothetical protein
MQTAWIALSATLSLATLFGCDTSCGKHVEPLLWADGVSSTAPSGLRTYATTPIDGTWLHFPSYRRFRLPHGFGNRDVSIQPYISLAVDRPAAVDGGSTNFAIASSGEVLATIEDENNVIVENSTCENTYYLFVSIKENSTATPDAGAN